MYYVLGKLKYRCIRGKVLWGYLLTDGFLVYTVTVPEVVRYYNGVLLDKALSIRQWDEIEIVTAGTNNPISLLSYDYDRNTGVINIHDGVSYILRILQIGTECYGAVIYKDGTLSRFLLKEMQARKMTFQNAELTGGGIKAKYGSLAVEEVPVYDTTIKKVEQEYRDRATRNRHRC